MLSELERLFLRHQRIGRLATADRQAQPHVLPVCFVVSGNVIYITIDEKAKAKATPLKRVRNIIENPAVAFVADRYDEDWSLLGWVMLRGQARLLPDGEEHRAQEFLRSRYPQLQGMQISTLPVIAIDIQTSDELG